MPKSRILRLVSEYERFRSYTLNLIPSENLLSPDVLSALGSTMAGRYAGRPESYGGSSKFQEIWSICESLARKIFRTRFATVMPVSGHIAGMIGIDSICRKGDSIAVIPSEQGGYKGYTKGYLPDVFQLNVISLPFDEEKWNIDHSRAVELLRIERPSLVILGATVYLFPHPVRAIAETVHSYGGKVIYDASHVMGLIAGGCFQDPIREGADLLLGSTHKTLFGPQGGMLVTNNQELWSKIQSRMLYRFIDNFHLNRVSALGVALEEFKTHGSVYASNVIRNSKALGKGLSELGIPVKGGKYGFTESHQVFLNYGHKGIRIRDALETNGIISDSRIRLGTNEVTRRGMEPREMEEISELISNTLSSPKSARIRGRVRRLMKRYERVKYTI